MSSPGNALNAPYFSGRWCDATGNLTPLASAVIRALMNRTGYAPGISSSDLADNVNDARQIAENAQEAASAADAEALIALLDGASENRSALATAQAALEAANIALLQARASERRALKTLETAQELTTLLATASPEAQAAQSRNESMTFSVMNRPWPSSHNPS